MAMSSVIGRLLEPGPSFAYQGRVLHAKTAVFDSETFTVGTYNLDARSRRYNRECNIAVYDCTVARASDRASSSATCPTLPSSRSSRWKQRSLAHRFFAWFAYPLRQFL